MKQLNKYIKMRDFMIYSALCFCSIKTTQYVHRPKDNGHGAVKDSDVPRFLMLLLADGVPMYLQVPMS